MPPSPRMLAAAAFALLVATRSPAGAAAEPSRDVETYVLFALEQLTFKGATGCGVCGKILGGNVGVNRVDPAAFTPLLSMGGADNSVLLGDGTEVVADTMRLGSGVDAFDVFASALEPPGAATIRHAGPLPFAAPIVAALPPFPSFVPGTTPVGVPKEGSASLPPGAWGAVVVGDRGTLVLAPGTYDLASLKLGRQSRLETTAGTVMRIAGSLLVGNDAVVGPADDARFFVRSDGVGANDPSVGFSRRTEFHGRVWAPNGAIALGSMTNLFGRFWGRTIGSDFNVNVNGPPTTPPPPGPPPEKDATLLHSAKNANEGANPDLFVGTQLRAVVGFDLSGIAPGTVKRATLVSTIDGLRPPLGWPAGGGTITVHRLLADFTEGNGHTFGLPPPEQARGTGPGVTWNCATDANIANLARDCRSAFFPGGFLAQPTASAAVTNGLGGTLAFDVTADVHAGASGWLLQKKTGSGQIAFYSKEGAAAANDPSLVPRLELEFF
ncbi:MAG TPA: hypothetical protein VFD84_04625 [Candidatus Binatia bacterium]|nr:hypothetical protein [Candidatus Binatia bacterium]